MKRFCRHPHTLEQFGVPALVYPPICSYTSLTWGTLQIVNIALPGKAPSIMEAKEDTSLLGAALG